MIQFLDKMNLPKTALLRINNVPSLAGEDSQVVQVQIMDKDVLENLKKNCFLNIYVTNERQL